MEVAGPSTSSERASMGDDVSAACDEGHHERCTRDDCGCCCHALKKAEDLKEKSKAALQKPLKVPRR